MFANKLLSGPGNMQDVLDFAESFFLLHLPSLPSFSEISSLTEHSWLSFPFLLFASCFFFQAPSPKFIDLSFPSSVISKSTSILVLILDNQELTHWKRLWYWEGLRAGGEGDDRGWDGWLASLTQWTWVWVNSGSWWWTGRPGVLQFMGSQRVGHDWATELNWTEASINQKEWYKASVIVMKGHLDKC